MQCKEEEPVAAAGGRDAAPHPCQLRYCFRRPPAGRYKSVWSAGGGFITFQ